jgi:hypothetical protein
VLRKEFAALKPAHVPEAPTHAARVAALTDAEQAAAADDTADDSVEAGR